MTGLRRPLAVLACLLLMLGAVAGVVNREVLDGSRFAGHADAVRTDARVAELVGAAITDQVVRADPDLVALRPAIQAVVVRLVASPEFTPVVQAAIVQAHAALTTPDSAQVILRLADLSAVVVAALKTVAPSLGDKLPPDLDVQLAQVGDQRFASGTLALTRTTVLLAWLLPTLAALCLFGIVLLSRPRLRGVGTAGRVVGASGAALAVITLGASLAISTVDTGTLPGALTAASWSELAPGLWRATALLALGGVALLLAAGAWSPAWSVRGAAAHATAWTRDVQAGPGRQLLVGGLLLLVGALAFARPDAAARAVVSVVALALLLEGVSRIAAVSSTARQDQRAAASSTRVASARALPRAVVLGAAVVAAVGLVAYLVTNALPGDRVVAALPVAADRSDACNGHVELCARRYDQVAYVSTHNSMSAADRGWFIPEQPTGLLGQLDAGVRTLLVDTWYGQRTNRPGVIMNAPGTDEQARAQAAADFGPEAFDSAERLLGALDLTPQGPVRPYLCHSFCPLGASLLLTELQDVQAWMVAHPRDVVTFIIQDAVSPTDTAKVFDEAGLTPFAYTHAQGQPWPTLGMMVASGKRLQVFQEQRGGGPQNPWMLKAFDNIQDTPYDNSDAAALTCTRLRGQPDSPLLLINNIVTRFSTRVSDSAQINALGTLLPYVQRCRAERGQLPNFVAVDFYDQGDVFAVVDRLNGVA